MSAKEHCVVSGEHALCAHTARCMHEACTRMRWMYAKEPFMSAKEAFMSAKEACVVSREHALCAHNMCYARIQPDARARHARKCV